MIRREYQMRLRTANEKSGFRLFLLSTPLLVMVFVFSYIPLLGWSFAFVDYKAGISIFDSDFVGLKHFTSLFANPVQRMEIIRVMTNTLGMSMLGILTTPLPVIFAMFLLEIKAKPFRKITQTLTTLPNFVSWVVVFAIAFAMLSVEDGFVNRLLVTYNFIDEPINFLISKNNVWLTMTGYGIWKGLGWGSIIYIAAITSIDPELYEAATVDGAGRFQTMWHITVPGILSTYFVLLLLQIANFINTGMEQYFIFENPMNKNMIEVLDLYIYNRGLLKRNISFATAAGMLKSLISIILLFSANGLSKIVRKQSII